MIISLQTVKSTIGFNTKVKAFVRGATVFNSYSDLLCGVKVDTSVHAYIDRCIFPAHLLVLMFGSLPYNSQRFHTNLQYY